MPERGLIPLEKKEGTPVDWKKILESLYSPTGYKGQQISMPSTREEMGKEFQPQIPTGQRTTIPRGEMATTREAFATYDKMRVDYKVYLETYNKAKSEWEKQEEERKNRIMAMYQYAVENRLPSYEPSVSQVGMGAPFGVPINIFPMLMQQLTQQDQQRQQVMGLQKDLMGLPPEVLAGIPPEKLGMLAQYQEEFVQAGAIREAKTGTKERSRALGALGQRMGEMIQWAKDQDPPQDPAYVVNQLMSTPQELLEQEFGYPITPNDIVEVFESYMKMMMGEYGG